MLVLILNVKGAHAIFAFVINFLGVDWHPKKIIIGFFEAIGIFEQSLAKKLIEILSKYDLIISYVKDEGFNLHIMTRVFKLVVSCEFWVKRNVFMVHVSIMHFLRLINMLQSMKYFVRV